MLIPVITGANLRIADYIELDSRLPIPATDVCFVCKKPSEELLRCSGCRTIHYCSRECQKQDWKSHKSICMKYLAQAAMGDRLDELLEKHRGLGTTRDKLPRSTADILKDLAATAQNHSSYCLGPTCWLAMGLEHDLRKSSTHFVGVTLSRALDSTNPRVLHSLVDFDVLPVSLLEERSRRDKDLDHPNPWNPVKHFQSQLKKMMKVEGAAGGALVVLVDVSEPKYKGKSVGQAIMETRCDCFFSHPLMIPLMVVQMLRKLPPKMYEPAYVKACLKNALDGLSFTSVPMELGPATEKLLSEETWG
ncbi:hypothetical protein C8F01DRAFT_1231577 [Mycena amicta]|nr:hypothetical protein C8F01DRAFT_1231577 [Mycena amicta]